MAGPEVECEQSLIFFRFSKGSARARERWAAKPRDARNEGGSLRRKKRDCPQSQTQCLSRLAPSITRMVICVSRAFCSTDQEKRETARSLVPKVSGLVSVDCIRFTSVPSENQQNCFFVDFFARIQKDSYLTPLKNLTDDILLPIRESFTVRLRRGFSPALLNPENFNVESRSRLDVIFFRPLWAFWPVSPLLCVFTCFHHSATLRFPTSFSSAFIASCEASCCLLNVACVLIAVVTDVVLL